MASATKKTRRRRQAKRTAMGQSRKRELRRQVREKTLEVARRLGLVGAGVKSGATG